MKQTLNSQQKRDFTQKQKQAFYHTQRIRKDLLEKIDENITEVMYELYETYVEELDLDEDNIDCSKEAISELVKGKAVKLTQVTLKFLSIWKNKMDNADFAYNKQSIISLNPDFTNKVISNVVEFDFSQCFPSCFKLLVKSENMSFDFLIMVDDLTDLRSITKKRTRIIDQCEVKTLWLGSIIKQVVNDVVGLFGSKSSMRNPKLHNEILQLARKSITSMQNEILDTGFKIICTYTDAVFFEVNDASQEEITELMNRIIENTQIQVEQTRFSKFFHSSQLNNYIGLSDGLLIQKGLTSGMKLLFADCHHQLLQSNGIVNIGNQVYQQAFDIIVSDDFEQACRYLAVGGKLSVAASFDEEDNSNNMIQEVSVDSEENEMLSKKNLNQVIRVAQLYGTVLDVKQTRNPNIKCRVETVVNGKTKFTNCIFEESYLLINYVDAQVENGTEFAIHEIYINQDNCFVVDIDLEVQSPSFDLSTEDLVCRVVNAIHDHPLLRFLKIKMRYSYCSYKNDKKHSVHLVFELAMPMHVMKSIIQQTKDDFSMEYLDTAIYSQGKSLRLFNCAKVVNGVIDNSKILTFDSLTNPMRLVASDITGIKHINEFNIDDFTLAICFQRQTTISCQSNNDITTFLESDDIPTAIHALRLQIEQATNLKINKFDIKQQRGRIQFAFNNQQCFICKRMHEQNSNNTIKSYYITGDKHGVVTLSLGCLRNVDKNEPLSLIVQNMRFIPNQQQQIINDTKGNTIQPYLPLTEVINRECLFIRSHMGSGKTSNIIKPAVTNGKSALLVTTRRVQTQLFSKILNMKSYIDHSGSIIIENKSNTSKWCVQLESLKRVSLKSDRLDVLILDEIMSILQQANQDVQKGSYAMLHQLVYFIQHANRIIICDSQLEQSTIDLFTSIISNNDTAFTFREIINTFQPFTDRSMRYYTGFNKHKLTHKAIVQATIIKEAKRHEGIWIVCGSCRLANELKQVLLANDYNESDIALFTGKNDDIAQDHETMAAFKNRIFSDITQLDSFKFVISTSSITSGIDVNSNHFTLTIGILSAGTFSAQQAVQALHRARKVREMIIFTDKLTDYKSFSLSSSFDIMSSEFAIKNDQLNNIQTLKLTAYTSQYLKDLSNLGSGYLKFQLLQLGYPLIQETIDSIDAEIHQQQQIQRPIATKKEKLSVFLSYFPIYTTNKQKDLMINTTKWRFDKVNLGHLLIENDKIKAYKKTIHLDLETGLVSMDHILTLAIDQFAGRNSLNIKKTQFGFQDVSDAVVLFLYEHNLFSHFAQIKEFRELALLLEYEVLCLQSDTQLNINSIFYYENRNNIHNYTYLLQYITSWIYRFFESKKIDCVNNKELSQTRHAIRNHYQLENGSNGMMLNDRIQYIRENTDKQTTREIKALAALMVEHNTVSGMTPSQLSAYFKEKKPNSTHYVKIAAFAGYQFESKKISINKQTKSQQQYIDINNIFDITEIIVD